MIIAIDESGSFDPTSTKLNFFAAVHLRQRKTLYKSKKEHFEKWEKNLPRSLKNAKGEIKSSSLSEQQLEDFAANVVRAHYYVGITPLCIRPSDNPPSVINNIRSAQMIGIRDGSREYAELGRPGPAKTYEDMGNWFSKLSYTQYLKIVVLGKCITSSLVNTVGHSISGGYDDELGRIRFIIDRDFIREPYHNVFWREILRNQIYSFSRNDSEKYTKSGQLNLNDLFWNNCSFAHSHEHFELRIADAVNTILSRCCNDQTCLGAYDLIKNCLLRDGCIHQLVLDDVDLSTYRYSREENPWRNSRLK